MSYLERDGRTLHYQLLTSEAVEAPLVVYLHGLLMDNLSSGYFTFAHRLRERAHVLLFDLFGHGRSSVEDSGYRPGDHIADLRALIERTQQVLDERRDEPLTRPLVLIGCSYGGVLALKASHEISQVSRVILLEGHLGHEGFVQRLRADLGAKGSEAEALLARHFQHWLHRGSERKRRRLAERSQRLIYESSLIADLEEHPLALEELITPISAQRPIDALYGSESDALPATQSLLERRAEAGVRGDSLKIFPGKTHALLWEATEEVINELECCIERVKAIQLKG